MKHGITVRLSAALFMTALLLFPFAADAEYIFLKDGQIFKGAITSDEPHLIVARIGNETKRIPRNTILRILYTELNMGKVYIQKRDGTHVIAYIVDEDRMSYTYRLDLYDPKESNLKRSEVLFVAEKNPSALKGEAETDRIKLSWLPPYDEVKEYHVLMKKKKADKYELIAKTKSLNTVVKDLTGNTNYFLIVTAIDAGDYESPPSNELTITTKNNPPTPCDAIRTTPIPGGGYNIIWKESTDIDGKVVLYRIYKEFKGEKTILAEVKTNSYTFKNTEEFDSLSLCAVDDMKAESEERRIHLADKMEHSVDFQPSFILPLGKLAKMSPMGFGAAATYSLKNLFIENLILNGETGFYYMTGKKYNSADRFDNSFILPVMVGAAWNFEPRWNISVVPGIRFGAALVGAQYHANDQSKGITNLTAQNSLFVDFIAKTGADLKLRVTQNISLGAGIWIGTLVEKKGALPFVLGTISAGYRF